MSNCPSYSVSSTLNKDTKSFGKVRSPFLALSLVPPSNSIPDAEFSDGREPGNMLEL